jgi:hypothetical protein
MLAVKIDAPPAVFRGGDPAPTLRTRRPVTASPTVVHDVALAIAAGTFADLAAGAEQRRGDRIVTERSRHVRRCLYVPPRGRSRSVTTIPIL